jgi:hypothetical protein
LVEEAVFSPSCVLGFFVEDQLAIYVWFMSGSSILIHWSSCLFLCQYHAGFIFYLFIFIFILFFGGTGV